MSAAVAGPFDLAVVGAGICGLAHALAAARLGKRVVVIDRDAQANGASIRNFGFVTVTGQQRGRLLAAGDALARRLGRDRPGGGHPHRASRHGPGGAAARGGGRAGGVPGAPRWATDCELLTAQEAARALPDARRDGSCRRCSGARTSSGSSRATRSLPSPAGWPRRMASPSCAPPRSTRSTPPAIETSRGRVDGRSLHRLPGRRFSRLVPGATRRLRPDALQAAHAAGRGRAPGCPPSLAPSCPTSAWSAIWAMPSCPRPRRCGGGSSGEQPEHLANGVHLIAVQSADGSLVVGDSHHYGTTPDPFAPDAVDALILDELRTVVAWPAPVVRERWTGVYASAPGSADAGRPAFRCGADRGDHQRHRRQHLLRHRRGGDWRAVRTGEQR